MKIIIVCAHSKRFACGSCIGINRGNELVASGRGTSRPGDINNYYYDIRSHVGANGISPAAIAKLTVVLGS